MGGLVTGGIAVFGPNAVVLDDNLQPVTHDGSVERGL